MLRTSTRVINGINYSTGGEKMNKKRSKTALIAMVIGVAYGVYALSYWFGGGVEYGADTAANVGTGLATAIVFPHTILAVIGAFMNVIGYFSNSRGFILTGAILYTVSLVVFPVYFMFVIIQMILSYIAFVRMKKEV